MVRRRVKQRTGGREMDKSGGGGVLEQGGLQQEQSRRVAAMVMGRRVAAVPGCTESPAPVVAVVLAELL